MIKKVLKFQTKDGATHDTYDEAVVWAKHAMLKGELIEILKRVNVNQLSAVDTMKLMDLVSKINSAKVEVKDETTISAFKDYDVERLCDSIIDFLKKDSHFSMNWGTIDGGAKNAYREQLKKIIKRR